MHLKHHIYEYPLNEKIRLFLRLESLFAQIDHFMSIESGEFSKHALSYLLDLVTITMRHELKSDLLYEFDKISQSSICLNPNYLEKFKEYANELHQLDAIHLDEVRKNEFLNVLKQRLNIIGGTCNFDLPILANWMRLPLDVRNAHIQEWLSPFLLFKNALLTLLEFIRFNMRQIPIEPMNGFCSQSFPRKTLLIQINLDQYPNVFPEISGNFHRTNIHFLVQDHPNIRPKNFTEPMQLVLGASEY